MSRLLRFCLASVLSLAGSSISVHAYDSRIDPDMTRRTKMTFAFSPKALQVLKLHEEGTLLGGQTNLPSEYASAMTWYRVALADGYTQPPIVASSWSHDEQLPEPLHWTWVADNGDLITRVDKGLFRLSFANNRSNWFYELDCRLLSWPDGQSTAPMLCSDGKERKMQVPGDGIVLVDDVLYMRVFDSIVTTLPPEEIIDVDELTAAAIEAAKLPPADGSELQAMVPSADPVLPDQAPIPPAR